MGICEKAGGTVIGLKLTGMHRLLGSQVRNPVLIILVEVTQAEDVEAGEPAVAVAAVVLVFKAEIILWMRVVAVADPRVPADPRVAADSQAMVVMMVETIQSPVLMRVIVDPQMGNYPFLSLRSLTWNGTRILEFISVSQPQAKSI